MKFFTRFGAVPAQETIGAASAVMRPLRSLAATPAGNLDLSGEEKCTIRVHFKGESGNRGRIVRRPCGPGTGSRPAPLQNRAGS